MKTWEINKTLYKVSDFLSWQKNSSLLLNPTFQRRSVWKKGAKSYLIDTITRGLPVPIIFLRERRSSISKLEPIREVVDGQQRLRTLISYIAPQLLKDYNEQKDDFRISKSHNKEFAGARFSDLPDDIQQQILDYQFSVHVLPSSTDDREVLQIFGRMNSTGMKLNEQELRNAEFFGEFKTSVYESALKHLNYWRKWMIFSDDNIARMSEVELCSELYIMILKSITGKSQATITQFYQKYDEVFEEREILEQRFEFVMEEIENKFGDYLSTSVFHKSTMFYTFFTVIYDVIFGIESPLKKKVAIKLTDKQVQAIKKVDIDISSGSISEKIKDATSTRRATNITQRNNFFNFLKIKLK